MSLKITIFDCAIPMLDKIAEANYGQALDALEHAGIKLRTATRRAFLSSSTHISQQYDKHENFKIRGSKTRKIQQVLGQRISHRNKGSMDNPSSMANFITSNLMTKSMTMVIAGKHGKLRPKLRRDGKVTGFAKSVGSVTKGSYAILQKLNSGDSSESEYKKVHRTKVQHRIFDDMKFRKQNFIEKGRAMAMPEVRNIMTTKLESMIHKQINRATVKTRDTLKKWVTDTLYNSAEYTTLCTTLVGSKLNYYRSAPMNDVVETLPFMSVYSDEYKEDDLSQQPWNETWVIPIAIAITSNEDSIDDSNVEVWESTDIVEQLAVEAKKILKREANGCGVSGEAINVLGTDLAVSEIGEADDVQASMFITFGKLNSI